MTEAAVQQLQMSRRDLFRTAAILGVVALPLDAALGQQPTKYRRLNISDPGAGHVLDSYKKAIRAMLSLPPTDPRNWYRIAVVHMLDCPHGNWWFLPWHRGYIGWFEQICRELSGDPEFALPYWDWTENLDSGQPFRPGVPAVMFDDVLTPTHPLFIAKHDEFKAQFQNVLANLDYWKRIYTDGAFNEQTQYGQILARGIRFAEDLWFDVIDDPRGKYFFDLFHARGLTKQKPEFDERTTRSVTLATVLDALSPRDFLIFGSPKTLFHSGLTGFGVLEGQPHNRVHNNVGGISFKTNDGVTERTDVGGFMQANLSPVDPLFFLHHANIDRLWDVWTRKQQTRGYPILPNGYPVLPDTSAPRGSDYEIWSTEPFLFFVDSRGNPVTKTTAGDYATIGDFNYDYQPGSGEEIVPIVAVEVTTAVESIQPVSGLIVKRSLSATHAARGVVTIPPALLEATNEPEAPKLFAKITLALSPLAHAREFAVFLNAPDGVVFDTSSPHFMGTLSMFGHHTVHCPIAWYLPLSGPLQMLRSNNLLTPGAPLDIQVVADSKPLAAGGMAKHMDGGAELLSIVVEAH